MATLEEWENRLALDEVHRTDCLFLQDTFNDHLPMPAKFIGHGHIAASSADTLPTAQELPADKQQLHQKQHQQLTIVANQQQFLGIYAQAEQEMQREQEESYRVYMDTVLLYRQAVCDMEERVQSVLQLLDELKASYSFVADKSQALQQACEQLQAEQVHMARVADYMADHLAYFAELEKIAQLFNGPGEQVCDNEFFIPMLARLDECLVFVQQHLRYKDAELYLMRFRQCMTRGLSLIKLHFGAVLSMLQYDIQKQLTDNAAVDVWSPASAAYRALFFMKFRSVAPTLKLLLAEIEVRCTVHDEYFSLLRDCFRTYTATRRTLLLPSIRHRINDLATGAALDIMSLARDCSSYMLGVAKDEYNLFFTFFESGHDELAAYLVQLCGPFYDVICPLIIKEASIDILSALCHLMRGIVPADTEEAPVLEQTVARIIQDTQARLVFRAQSYLRYELQQFQPNAADLNYPAKLSAMHADLNEASDTPYSDWYPALHRTLYLLSKLYLAVNENIFQDMSQEALSLCLEKLKEASQTITDKQSSTDGLLFLIKHLLALREEISHFGSDFLQSERQLDFTSLRETVNELWANKTSVLNGGIFGLVQRGIPTVVEETIDAKQDVDVCLKRKCEELIVSIAKNITEPVSSFLVTAAAFKLRQDRRSGSLSKQSFGSEEQVTAIYESFLGRIDSDNGNTTIALYLRDEKTEEIICSAIRNSVLTTYRQFRSLLLVEYDAQLTASWLSSEQLEQKFTKSVQ